MYKFAFILNKKVEVGSLLNAVGHMGAALAAGADETTRKAMFFIDYEDADQNKHLVSGLSLIILKADNANQLQTAREKAKNAGLHFVDFTASMTEGSYEEQMERTKRMGSTGHECCTIFMWKTL